jgi:hypothetical protein
VAAKRADPGQKQDPGERMSRKEESKVKKVKERD